MAVKSKSGNNSSQLSGTANAIPVSSWGPTVAVAPSSWSMVTNSSGTAQTYAGTQHGRAKIEDDTSTIYHIDVKKVNIGGNLRMLFLTEEEFVFSFESLYNSLTKGERFALTADSIVNIENVDGITANCRINGVNHQLSPFYLLKRAKELKNDK